VHQSDRAADPPVAQVGVERGQLVGREHALVDEGTAGQRREVRRRAPLPGLPLGPLAHAVRDPLKLDAGQRPRLVGRVASTVAGGVVRGEEHLAHQRHRVHRRAAQPLGVDRHVPPAQHLGALDLGVLLQHPGGEVGGARGMGQEDQAGGVPPGRRQREVDDVPEQLVRHLEHDPGAVAGVRFRTPRAPVIQPDQRREALGDHVGAAPAVQVRHERHAARVMLVRRVVQRAGGACTVDAGLRCVWVRKCHRASCRHSPFSYVGRRRP
jgi:hypothetical protein